MDDSARQVLREIGKGLDRHVFPEVHVGGVVMPSDVASGSLTLGKEQENGESKAGRPEARPRTGAAGRERPADRPRASGYASSVVGAGVPSQYGEDEVGALREEYPRTQLWHQKDGLWLIVESALLKGLSEHAIFVLGVASDIRLVRSWGFWGNLVGYPTWIGPRHTNFPDGSICAFEQGDATWLFGDSLIKLVDLYSLWAVRQLYLAAFGRWPGHQAVHHPYERLLELRADEHCGCGSSERLYGECCLARDLARNRIADAAHFLLWWGAERKPPSEVVRFARERANPPLLLNVMQ